MEDKYKLSDKEQRFLLKKNLVEIIYNAGKFEGLNTTLLQTKEIIDYNKAINVNADDVVTIIHLKRGFLMILTSQEPDIVCFSKQANAIIAKEDALYPGEVRTGSVIVSTLDGAFSPPLKTENEITKDIHQILTNQNNSQTRRALELFAYMTKNQIFWDGNKRTATVTVNRYMYAHGLGLFTVPDSKFVTFNKHLGEFYNDETAKEKLMRYMYKHCIFGIDYLHDREVT